MPDHISTIPGDLTGQLNWFYNNYFKPLSDEDTYEAFDIFIKGIFGELHTIVPKKLWVNLITREYLPDYILEDMGPIGPELDEFCHIWDIHSVLDRWQRYLKEPSWQEYDKEWVGRRALYLNVILRTLTGRWITDLTLQDYSVIFEGERISLDEYAIS